MQTVNVISTTPRPANGQASGIMPGAVTAVLEPKTASPDSTTVRLSEEARGRYVSDQNEPVKKKAPESPLRHAGKDGAKKADGSEDSSETDAIAETLENLQQLLKEALERLRIAQQQMAMAMAEMKNATDESQKMAAMIKVQAAQTLVISAQGEVLVIYAQISSLLQEQQKQAAGSSG